ncbi:efflux RND transporter periplasmic adaptor subunit [Rhodoblastus sp.]|uniref:efflux RND transporter periplasmic adaptor subunit n=1 Tax=Rhodoblastus sp. TaxID=1962975 RepID=UPI0035AEFE3B
MSIRLAAVVAAFLSALVCATPSFAHEGHDHDAARPAIAHVAPRAEAQSAAFELVAVPKGDALEIWLDRFGTNAPVDGATISVETPTGSVEAVAQGPGIYRVPAPWATRPGRTELIFTVVVGSDMDVLPATLVVPDAQTAQAPPAADFAGLGKISPWIAALALFGGAAVPILLRDRRRLWAPILGMGLVALFGAVSLFAHEGHEEAVAPAPTAVDRPGVTADGMAFIPKASQRILAARTQVSQSDSHNASIELPGRVIPDPNASGIVTAATAGRLSPPPEGFPHLGQSVKKGDILAYSTVPFLAVDRSTLNQMAGDLDQQISIVERRLARQQALIKTQTVAQATLDDTRLELDGLRQRRATIETGRREPEPLVAPIDGVIASANAAAGQIADANAVIFQIVDPRRLWVEAMAFEPKALSAAASARTAEGKTIDLDYVGAGLADRNQAVPVDFAVRAPTENLRLGQFVTVTAATSGAKQGIALPRASVVRRGNGQTVVFEHVRAELFAPRDVRVEPLDSDHVLVLAGLTPGQRIVTQAASLIDQVR